MTWRDPFTLTLMALLVFAAAAGAVILVDEWLRRRDIKRRIAALRLLK